MFFHIVHEVVEQFHFFLNRIWIVFQAIVMFFALEIDVMDIALINNK